MESSGDPYFTGHSASHHCNGHFTHHETGHLSTAYEPVSILTQLHERIAQLETELVHARSQRDTAQTVNTYLLETLTKRSKHQGRDEDTTMQRLSAINRENRRLRAKLALTIRESCKQKLRTRLALFKLSSLKSCSTDSAGTRSATSSPRGHIKQPTALPGTLIDLIDVSENYTDENSLGLVPSPSSEECLPYTPKNNVPDEPVTPTKLASSTDAASDTYVDHLPQVNGVASQRSSLFNSKYASTYRPNYIRYDFKRTERTTDTESKLTDTEHEPVNGQTMNQEFQLVDISLAPNTSSSALGSVSIDKPSDSPVPVTPNGLYMSAWAPTPAGSILPEGPRDTTAQAQRSLSGLSLGPVLQTSFTANSYEQDNHPARDGVFDTVGERERAIEINRRSAGNTDLSFPELFRHGLFYRPSEESRNVFRTVVIDNLPSDVTLAVIMEKVRGGPVVALDLLNTTAVSGCMSVMIEFLYEQSATIFTEYASVHPIHFSDHQRVRITQLKTPTWPLSPRLHKAIWDHGHTRCLVVRNLPSNITRQQFCDMLRQNRYTKHNYIQSLRKNTDGTVHVVMQSVRAAGWAFAKLTSFRDFRGCQVAYGSDPCNQPLEIHSGENTTPESSSRIVRRYKTTINSSGDLEHNLVAEAPAKSPVTDTSSRARETSPQLLPSTIEVQIRDDFLIDLADTDEIASPVSSAVTSDDTPSPNGTLRTRSYSSGSSATTMTVVPSPLTQCGRREPKEDLKVQQTMIST